MPKNPKRSSYWSLWPMVAVLYLAVFVFFFAAYFSNQKLQKRVAEFKIEQLKAEMDFLTDPILEGRRVGTVGEDASALYLKIIFKSLGYETAIATFSLAECWGRPSPIVGKNIFARLGGQGKNQSEIIVVSAHYDGVGSSSSVFRPAADDNASGTVALLALAEKLRFRKWNHSILLAAFGGEESGICGSAAFAKGISSRTFRYNINLDMVGRPREVSPTTIVLVGNDGHPEFVSVFQKAVRKTKLKLVFGKDLPNYPPWGWASDHRSFRNVGVPAVMLCDGNGSVIHSPSDVKETIDFDYLNQVVTLVFEALKRLDKQ